jgi:hypothetical protein
MTRTISLAGSAADIVSDVRGPLCRDRAGPVTGREIGVTDRLLDRTRTYHVGQLRRAARAADVPVTSVCVDMNPMAAGTSLSTVAQTRDNALKVLAAAQRVEGRGLGDLACIGPAGLDGLLQRCCRLDGQRLVLLGGRDLQQVRKAKREPAGAVMKLRAVAYVMPSPARWKRCWGNSRGVMSAVRRDDLEPAYQREKKDWRRPGREEHSEPRHACQGISHWPQYRPNGRDGCEMGESTPTQLARDYDVIIITRLASFSSSRVSHAQENWHVLEEGDIEEALRAATVISDDRLQRKIMWLCCARIDYARDLRTTRSLGPSGTEDGGYVAG